MATYYSQGTGNFSTLANWDTVRAGGGTDPASVAAMNNNVFVIQPGHTVTFDIEDAPAVDGSVSGWADGITLTLEGAAAGGTPGTLALSTADNTPGRVYGLRLKAAITGTATAVPARITGGSAETPMPTGANHVFYWINTGTSARLDATNLDVALYALPPIERVYRLTAPAAIGATELQVEGDDLATDPATDTEWKAGWAVEMVGWVPYSLVSERSTLAATPTGAGVINLAAPLANAYSVGDAVVLAQRNIELRILNAVGTNGKVIQRASADLVNVYSCSVRMLAANNPSYLLYGEGTGTGPATVLSGGNYGCFQSNDFADGAVAVNLTTAVSLTSGKYAGAGRILGCAGIGLFLSPAGGGAPSVITGLRIECCAIAVNGNAFPIDGAIQVTRCLTGFYTYTGSITGAHVISHCSIGLSLWATAGTQVSGSSQISDCATGIVLDGPAVIDGTVAVSDCDVGLTAVNGGQVCGDVTFTDCGVAFDKCNNLTLGGNLAVTGCLTGLQGCQRCIIQDDVAISAIDDPASACLENCVAIVLQDRAQLSCANWIANGVAGLVIDGPDVVCGTEDGGFTFRGCDVQLYGASVFPQEPYDEACSRTLLEGYDSSFNTLPDADWPTEVDYSEKWSESGLGGLSYLRMWNYGGVPSRYPHVWCGRMRLFPESGFSPMPAGEPEVVVCRWGNWESATPCWYEVPLGFIQPGLFEIDALFCGDPAGITEPPEIGVYDAPRGVRGNGTALAVWTPTLVAGEWQRTRLRWMNPGNKQQAWLRFTVTGVGWDTLPWALAYREVSQPQGPFGLSGPRINAAVSRTPITLPAWER